VGFRHALGMVVAKPLNVFAYQMKISSGTKKLTVMISIG
jgi:hypothetical protein